jgi:undecaprenyl diphosphate synthase
MLDPDLLMKIDKGKLPRHIAIVMDGNGRWAQRRVLPRHAGHRAGVMAVDDVVTTARKLSISC